jgi:hypothetical protein
MTGRCDFKFCKTKKRASFPVDNREVIGHGIKRDEILVMLGTALISTCNKTLIQGYTTDNQ